MLSVSPSALGRFALSVCLSGAALAPSHGIAEPEVISASVQIPPIKVRFFEDTGAAERLATAAALRTLAESTSTAACYLQSGIAPEESRNKMIASANQFGTHLRALEQGDPAAGIAGAETKPRVLRGLRQLQSDSNPMIAATYSLASNPANTAAYTRVTAENARLADMSFRLFSELKAAHSNPAELMTRDAVLIDLAGRQQMLTQKIAGIACELWSSAPDATKLDLLRAYMTRLQTGTDALMNGLPELGIKPAPTAQIKSGLEAASKDWKKVQPILQKVMAGKIADAEKSDLFHMLTETQMKWEKVMLDYVQHSKHLPKT